MYVKPTRSGGHTYAQLVESYRDECGRPRQRTLCTLGRLDEVGGQVDSLLRGLLRAKGVPESVIEPPLVSFDSALALGDVWVLDQLWRELGFDALSRIFGRARYTTDIEQAVRVMVFNRLCNADSKLGVLRWLQTVSMSGVDVQMLSHQHLLRSMDALMDHGDAVDSVVSALLRPLVDQELSLVFYDLTTIRAAGLSEQAGDVRRFGMSKEGLIARQFMLGVVQTADGLPIYHEVFEGNQAEAPTLLATVRKVLVRFAHIKRLILVADRGLLSVDNLEELGTIELKSGQMMEFILAVPGRRYAEFEQHLSSLQTKVAHAKAEAIADPQAHAQVYAQEEILDESTWKGHRLIAAHHLQRATEQGLARRQKLDTLLTQADLWAGKLDAQDSGKPAKGRKLSDSGAKARLYHAVKEAHLAHILEVDLRSDVLHYSVNPQALARAEVMDGKLVLVSNAKDLSAQEIVQRYKSLADIERGFRVLKSEIEIAPVHHRLSKRIKAHAMICFMALIVYRVMRQRLHQAKSEYSPERALEQLRRIQRHSVRINDNTPVQGIGTINDQQAQLFAELGVSKPTKTTH